MTSHKDGHSLEFSRGENFALGGAMHKSFSSGMAVILAVLVSSCGGGGTSTSDVTSVVASVNTYTPIRISGSFPFSGQAEKLRGDVPANLSGSYCLPSSLVLENRTTRFKSLFSNSESAFVFYNSCKQPANLLVCVFAGSGGNLADLPVCNVDPYTTPLSRLASISMAAEGNGITSAYWVENRGSIDVNIFYCAVGDVFAAGAIPGKNATECVKR